jgi:hypothetical protein
LYFVNVKIGKGLHDYTVFYKRFRVLGKAFAKIHINGWFFGKVQKVTVDILLAVGIPKIYLAD